MLGPEPLVLDGRQALLDAQRHFSDPSMWGLAIPRGFYTVGWYGTSLSDERGCFGVVDPVLGLADLVGDLVEVTYYSRHLRSHTSYSVRAYIIGSVSGLGMDMAITRRTYMDLELLAIEPVTATVSVVGPPSETRHQDTYRNVVIADNPVAYYRLANTQDEAGGPNAQFVDAVPLQPSLLPSQEGSSTRFDRGAGVIIPHNPALFLGDKAYSIELWLRSDVSTGWEPLIGQDVAVPAFSVALDSQNGSLGAWRHNIGGHADVGGDQPLTEPWLVGRPYYLVWSYTVPTGNWASTWRLYVNGRLVATGTPELGAETSAAIADTVIGGALPAAGYPVGFDGHVQELALYDYPLSQAQVTAHLQAAQVRPV